MHVVCIVFGLYVIIADVPEYIAVDFYVRIVSFLGSKANAIVGILHLVVPHYYGTTGCTAIDQGAVVITHQFVVHRQPGVYTQAIFIYGP